MRRSADAFLLFCFLFSVRVAHPQTGSSRSDYNPSAAVHIGYLFNKADLERLFADASVDIPIGDLYLSPRLAFYDGAGDWALSGGTSLRFDVTDSRLLRVGIGWEAIIWRTSFVLGFPVMVTQAIEFTESVKWDLGANVTPLHYLGEGKTLLQFGIFAGIRL